MKLVTKLTTEDTEGTESAADVGAFLRVLGERRGEHISFR